jgi:hypothetical protein
VERIRPKQCFHLRSGEVVRVNAIHLKKIHGELFDSDAKQWIPLRVPMPTWTLYAPCQDPTVTGNRGSAIRRWWDALRSANRG